MTRIGQAVAHGNIALVKYWGKREGTRPALNLPAVGSLSLTLRALETETTVEFLDDPGPDSFRLDGAPADGTRVQAFLDLVRARAGFHCRARVETFNNFPTGAGLASSASGFAALALAATRAAALELDPPELSRLARRGSGSAARSIFGGIVELARGERDDGRDCVARQLAAPDHWPLRVVLAITTAERKATGSTAGMRRTAETSPYYAAWIASHAADLATARAAIEQRDFERLAKVTEASCLKMHAAMMTATPALIYWSAATVAALEAVSGLRARGVPVCFTIDAGPQLKAVCEPGAAEAVCAALRQVDGVQRVLVSELGPGAR